MLRKEHPFVYRCPSEQHVFPILTPASCITRCKDVRLSPLPFPAEFMLVYRSARI